MAYDDDMGHDEDQGIGNDPGGGGNEPQVDTFSEFSQPPGTTPGFDAGRGDFSVGSQKGNQTTKGNPFFDRGAEYPNVSNYSGKTTTTPSWADRLTANPGGVGYAKAGIQQAHITGPDYEEESVFSSFPSLDSFSSMFSLQNPVAPKGTIATDYGINKNITADPEEIASHREETAGDKVALLTGIAGAALPVPNPITTPIGIFRASSSYADRMKAKGVEGYARSRDIDTTQTMNYGTPKDIGVSPTWSPPPSFGEGGDYVYKPKVPTTTKNNVSLAVEDPYQNRATPSGPTRAQLRGWGRQGRTGRGWV